MDLNTEVLLSFSIMKSTFICIHAETVRENQKIHEDKCDWLYVNFKSYLCQGPDELLPPKPRLNNDSFHLTFHEAQYIGVIAGLCDYEISLKSTAQKSMKVLKPCEQLLKCVSVVHLSLV